MKLILLGAPGAGKGTVAKLLTRIDGSVQISTGDILRAAIRDNTELGKEAKGYMNRGELVPDSLIMNIMGERLQQDDCKNGYLLDGFPRTIPQAEGLKTMLSNMGEKLDMVVDIQVPRDEVLARLTTRRTCSNPECQAIYNTRTKPSKVEGVCDICGSPTIQRDDETVEAITTRLEIYEQQTAPLVDFYRDEGFLISVDGTLTDAVIKAVKDKLANSSSSD